MIPLGLLLLLSCACKRPGAETGTGGPDSGTADGAALDGGATTDGGAADGGAADGGAADGGVGGVDADGDGATAGEDCDDGDPAVHPGAEELCDDGVDQDCDGTGIGCRPQGALSVEDGWVLVGESGSELGGAIAAGELLASGGAEVVLGGAGASRVQVYSFESAGEGLALAFEVAGEAAGDALGSAIAVGDVDGDGHPDLVLAAKRSDRGGEDAGAAWVLAGPLADAASLDDALVVLEGEAPQDLAGGAVVLGNLDGVGGLDLVIGIGQADRDAENGGGAAVVLDLDEPGARSLGPAAWLGWGRSSGMAGSSLAAGDLDGDGIDDVVVGVFAADGFAGAAAVALGPHGEDRDLASDADALVRGAANYDVCGIAVATGDLDGDGAPELIVACAGDDAGGAEAGVILVYSEPAGPLGAKDASGTLLGAATYDRAGWSLGDGGDVDGDGRADLVVGTPGHEGSTGAGWLAYGPLGGTRSLDPGVDARWLGSIGGGLAGDAVAGVGDVTDDGAPDLVVAAPELATAWLLAGSGL